MPFSCGKLVYKTFADRLPLAGSEHVLDFGCGMGTVAYYVMKRLPKGQLTCIDISERWLNTCRKTLNKYRNVSFIKSDFPELVDSSFNVVYCHFILHDISKSELEKVISVLTKSIKSGGTFIFREPLNETEKLNIIKRLVEENDLSLKNSRITDIPLMGSALTKYLKEHFSQEKIYLIGESWGSALGIFLIDKYPESYHGFIGTAQMVDFAETERMDYRKVMEIAEAKGDTAIIEQLKKNGLPPYYGKSATGKVTIKNLEDRNKQAAKIYLDSIDNIKNHL